MSEIRLHTTADREQAEECLQEILDSRRFAYWTHCHSVEDRDSLVRLVENRFPGIEVLPSVDYMFLACYSGLLSKSKRKLILKALPKETEEEAEFFGTMFGYSREDIDWYKSQLSLAEQIRRNHEG